MTATAWTATRADRARHTRCWRCDNTDQTPCHTDRRWEIGITHRGWRSDRTQIVLRPGACRATVETNAEYDFTGTDPRIGGALRTALLYRGACLGAGGRARCDATTTTRRSTTRMTTRSPDGGTCRSSPATPTTPLARSLSGGRSRST